MKISESELYSQLSEVVAAAESDSVEAPAVGVLTSVNRSRWSEARERLAKGLQRVCFCLVCLFVCFVYLFVLLLLLCYLFALLVVGCCFLFLFFIFVVVVVVVWGWWWEGISCGTHIPRTHITCMHRWRKNIIQHY